MSTTKYDRTYTIALRMQSLRAERVCTCYHNKMCKVDRHAMNLYRRNIMSFRFDNYMLAEIFSYIQES